MAAFADCYLSHAVDDQIVNLPEDQLVHHEEQRDHLQEQKVTVGGLLNLIRECNKLFEDKESDTVNPNSFDLLIAEKNTLIKLQRDKLWGVEVYQNLELTCDPDYFLEALLSCLKGAIVSFQTYVKVTWLRNSVAQG